MDKIRINDFRLSRKLFYLEIINSCSSGNNDLFFLKALAAGRINIEFLSRMSINKKIRGCFCIRSEFYDAVKALLDSDPFLKDQAEFIPSVGLITLFPHRFSLEILGQSVNAIGEANLPIYCIASSVSSITFVTDFNRLEEAVEKLKDTHRIS